MQILHIDLRSLDADYADLRYSDENLNEFESRQLPLSEIQDLIDLMERDYYVALPEGYVKTGRRLYNWLDGSDRWLSTRLGSWAAVLAILVPRGDANATGERLAHLPWEVMRNLAPTICYSALMPPYYGSMMSYSASIDCYIESIVSSRCSSASHSLRDTRMADSLQWMSSSVA